MKYLITGGCGFIGSNFAAKLLRRGDKVIVLDNLSRRGTAENLKFLKSVGREMTFMKADTVKDISLIEKLADKVYGKIGKVKIKELKSRYSHVDLPFGIPESCSLDFLSPYGCSKGAADQYVRDYARSFGLKTVVMRQSCIYGPRQFGIEDQGWVAWFTIASILNKKITIYGDGKQVRDILYVDDLFKAWDLAVKNIKKVSGEIFNVGGGLNNSLSLLELIAHLEKLLKIKINYDFSDWRLGDQLVYISDISSLNARLNWKPEISIDQGLGEMINWIKNNIKTIRRIF